jgi:pimeloyl-ACP methyl ester carboxylesterase
MKKVLLVFTALITVLVVLFIFRKDHTVSKEIALEKCAFPNSQFIDWYGRQIHYVEFGEKGKQQVLMVHGFGGSLHNFKSLIELMKDDFYILAIDLPGFALSDQPDLEALGTDSYLDAYHKFMGFIIDTFQLNDFHIIGNSLGGWISWETTYAFPDKIKSLTLITSAGYEIDKVSKNATAWLKTWWADALFKKGMPLYIARSNMENIFYDNSKVTEEGLATNYYNINKEGNFPYMLTLATAGELPDTSRIAQIKNPTLVIWGQHDKIVPVYHTEKFARDIEGSKVVIFEKCGHVPQIELPEETYAEILKFYQELQEANVAKIEETESEEITVL